MTYPAGIYVAEDGRAHVPIAGTGGASAPTTGTWRVGELAQDDAGTLWMCTVAGTPGTWLPVGADLVTARGLPPTGALVTTHPRNQRFDTLAAFTTNRSFAMLVHIPRPMTITAISQLCAGGTSFASITGLWFEIWDDDRVILAKTTDDGSTGWTNGTTKSLNLTAPLAVTAGYHYVATSIIFTSTNGTILGNNSGNGNAGALAPIMSGLSADTGITYAGTTVGATRGAITNNPFQPFFVLS